MDHSLRPVALWLGLCAVLVVAMMVIGAMTRLTDSGLSMTEWRPLMGTIPPLSAAEWQRVFDLYRQIPEYRLQNAGMSLDEFKVIFWWEYGHRVWGRLIGVVFLIPFLWFLIGGRLRGPFAWRVAAAFVLGGLQGVMGWYMVMSGLTERVDVSQYRLAAHFALALLILAWLLWLSRDVVSGRVGADGRLRPGQPVAAWLPQAILLALLSVVAVSGAFVAGIDAGLIHNDFPTMGGRLIPEDYWLPGHGLLANAFESHAAVQFHHRWLAMAAVVASVVCAWRWRARLGPAAILLGVVALAQLSLGIATLVTQVWPPLAAAHQFGAACLVATAVWLAHARANGHRAH